MASSLSLTTAMADMILNGDQLTDDIIALALDVIRRNNTGLITQAPGELKTCHRLPLPQPISPSDRSILIPLLGHTHNQDHWVCMCCENGNLTIYDPLNGQDTLQKLSPLITNIFVHPPSSIRCAPVTPPQDNQKECGVFAISYAVDWVMGHDPSQTPLEVNALRPHLQQMLANGQCRRFPVTSTGQTITTQSPVAGTSSQNSSVKRLASPVGKSRKKLKRTASRQEISESVIRKIRLWKINDEIVNSLFLDLLLYTSVGWKRKNQSFKDYLQSRKVNTNDVESNLYSEQIAEFNKTSPDVGKWDITFLYSLLWWTSYLAGIPNDLWKSIEALKKQRNTLAHIIEISPAESKKMINTVREHIKKVKNECLVIFPKRQVKIKENFKYHMNRIEQIAKVTLETEAFKKYARLIDLDNLKNKLEKEGVPMLKRNLNLFTTFSPVSHIVEPFSKHEVNVKDVFTELILEEEEDKEVLLENILDHTCHDDPNHLLLLKGDAGVGKTTMLKKIISDWIDKNNNSIKKIDSFAMVFHLECRDRIKSFNDYLCRSLGDVFKELGDKHLNPVSLGLRCLVLIDGYDEINDSSSHLLKEVLSLKKSYDLTVIITSRPQAEERFYNEVRTKFQKITTVRLEGIPEKKTDEFVRKYYKTNKIKDQSTQQIQRTVEGLLKYIEKTMNKMKDVWKLPYNLCLLTILWKCEGNVNCITTEAELHWEIFLLLVSKLKERLLWDEKTLGVAESILDKKLETFLWYFSRYALIGLKEDQIIISQSAYEELSDVCHVMALSAEQMIGAFLKEAVRGEKKKLFGFPHKATQELFAAYHILLQLTESDVSPLERKKQVEYINQMELSEELRSKWISDLSSNSLRDVSLKDIFKDMHPGEESLPLAKYQNLLCNIINLSQVAGKDVPEKFIKETLLLLQQSGLKGKDSWIKVINNLKCNDLVANWISNEYRLLDGNIEISDFSFDAYLSLLKALKTGVKSEMVLDIKLKEAPETIEDIAKAITDHGLQVKHLILEEYQEGRKPLEGASKEEGLRLLVQSCQKKYQGIWRKNYSLLTMRALEKAEKETLEETEKELYVRLEDPQSLSHLYKELQTVHISLLAVCLSASFGPIDVTQPISADKIVIEIHDTCKKDLNNVGSIIQALQPHNKPINRIHFRRMCPVEEEEFLSLLQSLTGVRVEYAIYFPLNIRPSSSSSQQRIEEAWKRTTGCYGVRWTSDLDK